MSRRLDDAYPASPSLNDFDAFMTRLREGDPTAAEELVRHYEPLVRRGIRRRIGDQRLRRTLDSMDLCQSVFHAFFYHMAAGENVLVDSDHLVRLLVLIARRKLAETLRKEYRHRRDFRRLKPMSRPESIIDPSPSPSQVISSRELAERIRERLNPEERQLADDRARGVSWGEIAERAGGSVESCRMQLLRAIRRVLRDPSLGISDDA